MCPLQNCSVNESLVICHRGQRDDEGTSCDKRVRELTGNWEGCSYPGQHGPKANWRRAFPARTPPLCHRGSWPTGGRTVRIQRARNLQILVYLCSVKLLQSRDNALQYATPHSASRWPKALLMNALLSSAFRYRFGQGLAGQSPTRDPYPMVVR